MATGDLASALAALQFAPTETPYGLAGATLAQSLPSLITPTTKPAQALGITLGGALIASLLGYQGQKQATQMGLEAAKQGARLAELPTATERAAYIESLPDVTGRTQIQNALLQYNQQLAGQDILAKALANQEVAKQKAIGEFELSPIGQQLYDRKVKQAILEKGISAGMVPTKYGDLFKTTPIPEAAPKEGLFGTYETTADKRNRLIRQAASLGVPPSDRLDYANKNLQTEELQTKAALKELEKIRENINNADFMISRATSGITGAGQTGGPKLYATARDFASSIYQYVPTKGGAEEVQQRAAQSELDSIRPEIVKQLRSPGAVSDYETKILIGSGPSSENTNAQNVRILSNMVELNKLNNDYVNFLESYIQDKGDVAGAKMLWDQYKKDEVIKRNQINPDRADWRDYFAQKKAIPTAVVGDVSTTISRLRAVLANPQASETTRQAALQEINKLLGQ